MTTPTDERRITLSHARGAQSCLRWGPDDARTPLVHFAHANGFHAATYRQVLAPLAGEMRVIAPDLRGHGATAMPADPHTHHSWALYRDDLVALIEALDDRPACLAGHSMGATTSLLAAIARPDLVRGLVLCDPVIIPRRFFLATRLMRLVGLRPPMAPIARAALQRRNTFPDRETMIRKYSGRGAFRTWPEDFLADYVNEGVADLPDGTVKLACTPEWEAANFNAATGYDYWLLLKNVTCPVTVLRGAQHSTCPDRQAERLKRRIPQLTDQRIESTTHFLPMERPDSVRDAIRAMVHKVTSQNQQS